ncbi:MAG TPA: pilus assembly protein TadG-related protein [Streptosporangiaceae bacterium]|nr:pilus assembly protein TadG-related protein [Streptosporangiaceae bacterium]
MRRRLRWPEPGRDRERGSLTLMLAVLMVALLALAGLVIDGGRKLNESASAYAIAQEAARAGAGLVDRADAYRTGTFEVDPGQAVAAARAYLATAGYRGSVAVAGADKITVTVTVTEPTTVLSLIGIDSMTSTGTAVASLVSGVTGPGT